MEKNPRSSPYNLAHKNITDNYNITEIQREGNEYYNSQNSYHDHTKRETAIVNYVSGHFF